MGEIAELTETIVNFRDARNWAQHHRPKDMAISLTLEAAELLEHFQFKSEPEIAEHCRTHKEAIADELADVFYWVLLMSHDLGINIRQASLTKTEKNGRKYPLPSSMP